MSGTLYQINSKSLAERLKEHMNKIFELTPLWEGLQDSGAKTTFQNYLSALQKCSEIKKKKKWNTWKSKYCS